MVFKIPRPIWTQAIVDKAGLATKAFSRRIEEALGKLETQETSQDATLVLVQQVQAQQAEQLALILSAQATASAAAQTANTALNQADAGPSGTATSGSASDSQPISGASWVTGPVVNLTGVVAGTLTITGTGPTGGISDDDRAFSGQYRVVELAGGTTVFTGDMGISQYGVADNSASSVAAFTLSESTTGAVSYRMDVRRSGGPSGTSGTVDFYFYARRS